MALYHTKQWGGADSKLLMGMGVVFGIWSNNFDFFWFLLVLLFVGAIYGVLWMLWLAVKHFSKFQSAFRNKLKHLRSIQYVVLIMTTLLLFTYFVWPYLILFAIFPPLMFYLFVFVLVVEAEFFVKKVNADKLTEGDWLAKDVVAGSKVILEKKTLEKKDIKFLKDHVKLVSIKEGIPFVPSFLLSYLIVEFAGNYVVAWLSSFF